jgi:hypothetical protein
MNKTLASLLIAFSFSAFAQDQVLLDAKEITVNGPEAVVLRTNQTPREVKISFRVPMQNSVCERYETRMIPRHVRVQCGQEIRYRRVPTGRVCTRTNPQTNQCIRWEERYRDERIIVPVFCDRVVYEPQTYCSKYGTATSFKRDSMKIEFNKLPALGDSEADSFLVKATQKNYDRTNVVYSIQPLETALEYKVKQKKTLGIFAGDNFEVTEK